MTGRQPFRRANADEVVDAILRQIPPLAAELNSERNQPISRVVHKGMAKQPWHRFSSARDFADSLNKALRNEPIEFFDPGSHSAAAATRQSCFRRRRLSVCRRDPR